MSLQNNLKHIRQDIQAQEKELNKLYGERSMFTPPEIIAVSKKQPDDVIDEALSLGLRHFGENRVQEAQERWGKKRSDYDDLCLHLLGPLQSNKVKDAVALFDVIHTVDREKIAKALGQEMKKQDKSCPCFIQINTGREEQKSGIDVNDLPEFLAFSREECGLDIVGLMAIPPVDEVADFHFALLKRYQEDLGLSYLSMGMSADYKQACRYGATHLRIGSALLGERVL